VRIEERHDAARRRLVHSRGAALLVAHHAHLHAHHDADLLPPGRCGAGSLRNYPGRVHRATRRGAGQDHHAVFRTGGRQFAVAPDAARTEEVKRRYALPERYILTLSGGDRAERKNFGAILEAFKRVHAQSPCALVVAGRGCEEFRTRYGIPDAGWGRDVHFPGWVDQADLPVFYRQAELFLYPSNMEAHPIPVTEALATGTPIVTSNAYGLKELAGDAALLVDPSDPEAIAAAVLKLVSDAGLRDALKVKAEARSKLFDWDVCAEKTLAILERVGQRA
jgi:glycosyltransferase involved in cell wall biosynthesis